jgi:glycosyltransferase involved in cell wall biosynthesis
MNYQSWTGVKDPKFGYGSMLDGFLSAAPKTITFDDHASVNVYMQLPNTIRGWHKGQHRVLFTMWETDTVPNFMHPWFNQFDQILVPCEHNVELFSKYHPDVTCVPLGVDLSFWRVNPEPPKRSAFRFHAGGSLWLRKGLDLVVRAFTELNLPDAELHIKAAPHAFDTEEVKHPRIIMHRNWMSKEEQRDWYDQADCFVAAARGEGFGLMPLQAIAMGIPTIVSETTGQREFMHLANWTVPCGKSKSQTVGQWDEPNLQQLKMAMQDAYDLRLPRERPAGTNKFSWAEAAKKLVAAVPPGKLLDNPKWETPTAAVKVRAKRTVKANIGNDTYIMSAGDVASIPPGAYEVLSDSGAVEMEPS